MNQCGICETKLTFSNTPIFNSGDLDDGNTICTDCFQKVIEKYPWAKVKKYNLNDIQTILSRKPWDEEIKDQIEALPVENALELSTREELKNLHVVLKFDARIHSVFEASYLDSNGLLLFSNHNAAFVSKGLLGMSEKFSYQEFSIEYKEVANDGRFLFHSGDKVISITNIDPTTAQRFVDSILELHAAAISDAGRTSLAAPTSSGSSSKDRLAQILEQILKLPIYDASRYLDFREVAELPEILLAHEVIRNLTSGAIQDKSGLLLYTDRRIIFIHESSMFFHPLEEIRSAGYDTSGENGAITLEMLRETIQITNVPKDEASNFANMIQKMILSSPQNKPQPQEKPKPPQNNSSSADIYDQLEKIGKLKKQGILSEEEFQEQKERLLEKLD